VIGSGATAMTIVPAVAETAEHVTMLQRSPTYVLSLPLRDGIAERLRRWLPQRVADPLIRAKNTTGMTVMYQFSRRAPERMKALLHRGVVAHLPDGFDVGEAFTPTYQPWDQRLCFVPDADLFTAIGDGRVSVVTDEIERITPTGVRLRSGDELPADIIVTATGLNLLAIGGIELDVDGRRVDVASSLTYRGMMLAGVPNFAFVVGYTNASWTLKADLVSRFACRLLGRMRSRGERSVTPLPPDDVSELRPVFDLQAGYVRRGADQIPQQGDRSPWRAHQNYFRDYPMYRLGRLDDGALQFSG
jgi:cation diffusion facilitator CzcD-associated flavoprotein CzcO